MPQEENAIVITGAGLISPLGLSRQATWEAVLQGRCGIGRLSAVESVLPPGADGGQAPDLPSDESSDQPREVRYLRRTIHQALDDAGGLDCFPYPPDRRGVLLGTTLHGMRAAGEFLRHDDPARLDRFLANATLARALEGLAIKGFCATTCSACSSSLGAIALGISMLRAGELDVVVAGGYDTISEYVYGGFNSLRLVSPGPVRPFTRGRQGMKLAEGYGIVVLERRDDALRRGAAPIARILGYGESADAHHLTQPHPRGEGAARAIRAALEDAKLSAADIGMVAAHGTGTPDNDVAEARALAGVFGDTLPAIPVVAFKSHLGHTLGGAGAVELILSTMALRDQCVPGCANVAAENLEFPDLTVSCGAGKPARLDAVLNTSLGFGGANTCVVLAPALPTAAAPEAPAARAALAARLDRSDRREVLISGVGVILPSAIGNEAFIARLGAAPGLERDPGPIPDEQFLHLLNARRVRRMSEYVKMTLAATAVACTDAGIDDLPAFAESCAAILGSTHGSANYSDAYYRQIVQEGIAAANPLLFAEAVPNAGAAHLSLMLSLKRACQTIIGSRTAGLEALRLAALRIATGEWDRAIVSAAEEHHVSVNAGYKQCGLYAGVGGGRPFGDPGGFLSGAGAVSLILESRRSLEQRRAGRIRGRIGTCAGGRDGDSGRAMSRTLDRVLRQLDHPTHLLGSANGTWIDALELAAASRLNSPTILSSLYGYFPELFAAGPLAGIAAVLLTHRLPALWSDGTTGRDGVTLAPQPAAASRASVLCSDYTGVIAAVSVQAEP